ncbi:hypothetical protein NSE_0728 [Neorickettsia sennetsu str. Miyayama]|uniref:Uncharacterized protein n=1 Tax=Ehrlichia sennetsu (strain ATCC VR-367 / Miyayama) TaxID=222891 RepID=Q2GD42_EHRS3|nr:hypothetical protein NSE_0728 [Neorickettsia sennetsu str. Miyayama]
MVLRLISVRGCNALHSFWLGLVGDLLCTGIIFFSSCWS